MIPTRLSSEMPGMDFTAASSQGEELADPAQERALHGSHPLAPRFLAELFPHCFQFHAPARQDE